MKRILGIAALAFFFLGAAPALATTCPANLQLKDNAGITAPGKYSDDGSGNCMPNAVPGAVISTGTGWTSATTLNATQTLMGTGQGSPALLVQLDQTSTITGGVVTFEGTYDNTNWVTIPTAQVLNSNTFASLTNPYTLVASTNQPFLILTQGYQSVRVRLSTVITGTATVTPQIALLPYNPASATAANQGSPTDAPCTLPATTAACSQTAVEKAIANGANSAVPIGSASGGMSIKTLAALTNTAIAVKASAGQVYKVQCSNTDATHWAFIQLFNVAAASVTMGTTAPADFVGIPPASNAGFSFSLVGDQYSTAISAGAA